MTFAVELFSAESAHDPHDMMSSTFNVVWLYKPWIWMLAIVPDWIPQPSSIWRLAQDTLRYFVRGKPTLQETGFSQDPSADNIILCGAFEWRSRAIMACGCENELTHVMALWDYSDKTATTRQQCLVCCQISNPIMSIALLPGLVILLYALTCFCKTRFFSNPRAVQGSDCRH